MNWPHVDALATLIPLPAGYRFAQFDRAHIVPMIAAIKEWHPAISVGVGSAYVREEFYYDKVCLDGRTDRDIWASPIMFNDELAGIWSIEREVDSLAIYGRLLILAPAHRGAKLSVITLRGAENVGRLMGAAFLYALATLKTPTVQRALESAGYQLLGFFPGYDREEISPGIVKRVYQSVYAKLLVPRDQVHWPDAKNMSPRAKALFELLFSDVPVADTRVN